MYSKVLVPLDGSELAECALPELIRLCKGGMVVEAILLRVVSTEVIRIPKSYERSIDVEALRHANRAEAAKYLDDVESRLKANGIKVGKELLEGRPEEKIIDYAKTLPADLIILATHGYTGMKRLMFGSVALQVLHDAKVPVLLIRAFPGPEKA
jgi:nucleotide-binding universal stress UspA family protein